MKWQFEEQQTLGKLIVTINDRDLNDKGPLNDKSDPQLSTFILNKGHEQNVTIDMVNYTLPAHSVLPLVADQHFNFERPEDLIVWQFNREFYCIADHDAEVGCPVFLFYGIHHPMFISLCPGEMDKLTELKTVFLEEMAQKDDMQAEMLRTLLKKLIIHITGIAKKQTAAYQQFGDDKMDIIRKFNLLLEFNFRSQHEVRFYAASMGRSPKTLSNFFTICNYPAPSKLIQQRIILEAKRYVHYTELSVKEIAYELGFLSPAHFSKFFKKNTGNNISNVRGMTVQN